MLPTATVSATAFSVAERSKSTLRGACETALRRLGFDLVRRSFYSPLPDAEHLGDEHWRRASALHGVPLELDRAVALLRELEPYLREAAPVLVGEHRFALDNA